MSVGDTYSRGESRHPEWDLMYRKGLTVGRIADLCGAVKKTVGRHLRVQRAKHPDMQAEHESNRRPAKPRPLRSSWQVSIEALVNLLDAEGRYPTSSDPAPERRRLGYWLAVQRRAHRDGTLSEAKLEALKALPGWERDQRKELDAKRWQTRLAELREFREHNNRWPRFRNAGSEAERTLGVWLHGQRQLALQGHLPSGKADALEDVVPGWNTWRRRRREPRQTHGPVPESSQ
jgi:hypothetical protein